MVDKPDLKKQKEFGKAFREARIKLGLTQEQLGLQIGVGGLTISRWERRNGTFPREYRWRRIRELWNLSLFLQRDGFLEDRKEPIDFSQ